MCAAVLIIAGGRPHYYDRPPVTEFYTLYSFTCPMLTIVSQIYLQRYEKMKKICYLCAKF